MSRIQAKPKLRWYQFGLSTLMGTALLTACVAWAVGKRLERLEYERRKAEALVFLRSRLGATVDPNIKELNCPSGLEPEALLHIVFLRKLERLSIRGGTFNANHLRPLRSLPSLRALELDARITEGGFIELASLPRLETLSLALNGVSTARLAQLKQLNTVVVKVSIDGAGCRHLAPLTKLESVRIWAGSNLGAADFEFLAAMPKLRVFWLQSSIQGDALRRLRDLPELTEVRLQANQLTDRDVRHLENCTRLKHLTLESNSGNFVTDAGLAVVAKMPNLRFLNVSRCRAITDNGLCHLKDLRNLKSLRLSDTGITDDGLQHLSALKNLVNLNLDDTAVTADGVMRLAPLPKLQTLKLSGTLTEETVAELRQTFPNVAVN